MSYIHYKPIILAKIIVRTKVYHIQNTNVFKKFYIYFLSYKWNVLMDACTKECGEYAVLRKWNVKKLISNW